MKRTLLALLLAALSAAPAHAGFIDAPVEIDFGSVAIGGSADVTFDISVTCQAGDLLCQFDFDNSLSAPYSGPSGSIATIDPDQTALVTVTVSFQPTVVGEFTDLLRVVGTIYADDRPVLAEILLKGLAYDPNPALVPEPGTLGLLGAGLLGLGFARKVKRAS